MRYFLLFILAFTMFTAFDTVAKASEIECWNFDPDSPWEYVYEVKPRSCIINGGQAHAYMTILNKIHWFSWREDEACGMATEVYNQGYRNRLRFCLYAPIDGAFTWIRGRTNKHYSIFGDHGERVYGTKKARNFDYYLFPTPQDILPEGDH